MEKFKACEKELKTKAYSKEGLSAAQKLDPMEQLKMELENWIGNVVDKLSTQVDAYEAESEVLMGAAKKSKKADAAKQERLTKIEQAVERHKHHMSTLEIILRMMENGALDPESVRTRDDILSIS
jgi:CCR4-NOT transcription complex subunit 3